MIIEINSELETIDFKSNIGATELDMYSVIDTIRDFAYTVNVNPLNEGLLELTIYLVHQEQATGIILVSYVGVVKVFLIDLFDKDKDKLDLIQFIKDKYEIAYAVFCEGEKRLRVNLENKLTTPVLCDKILKSLEKMGFYQ